MAARSSRERMRVGKACALAALWLRLGSIGIIAASGSVARAEDAPPAWPAMDSLVALSPATAAKIEAIAQIGTPVIADLAWSPGGGAVAVCASDGVAVYQIESEGHPRLARARVIRGKRPPAGISFGARDDVMAVQEGGRSIQLFDVRSGWTQAEVKDAGSPVEAMALAPAGFLLAAATADGKLRLWRDENLEEPPKVLDDFETTPEGYRESASGLSFDATGSWAVTWGGSSRVHVWDLKEDVRKCDIDTRDERGFNFIEGAAVGPGPTLWAATFRAARRWRLPDGADLPDFPKTLFSLGPWSFHPEGKLCLARGAKGPEIVAAADGKTARKLPASTYYGPAAFDRKGKWLAIASGGALSVLDVRSGGVVCQEKLGLPALLLALAPGGAFLAWGPDLRSLQIADLKKSGKSVKVPAEGDDVRSSPGAIALDPKGRFVATTTWSARKSLAVTTDEFSVTGSLPVLWQVTAGGLKRTGLLDGEATGVRSLAFSPDGEWLAMGTQWGKGPQVKLFSVRAGKVRATIDLPQKGGIGSSVQDLAFDPSGKLLAATIQGVAKLHLIDLAKAKVVGDISLPQTARYFLTALSFGPKGSTVAAGTSAGQVLIYDVAGRRLQKTIELKDILPQRLAVSPDGTLVAATGRSWKQSAPAEGGQAEQEPAAEEERAATSLVLYDIATGSRLHSAPAHATRASGLAFLQEGKVILTSATDGTVHLWGVKRAGDGAGAQAEKKAEKKGEKDAAKNAEKKAEKKAGGKAENTPARK